MTERTPSQTVGPFLHVGLVPARFGVREIFTPVVADATVPGTHIEIEGRIYDGEGNVLRDAMVEAWQADAEGRYPHSADGRPVTSNAFRGFGRCATEDGVFRFSTVKPGSVPGPGGTTQAPHINVGVSRAAFSSGCSRASTSRAIRPTPAIPFWRWCRPSGARR